MSGYQLLLDEPLGPIEVPGGLRECATRAAVSLQVTSFIGNTILSRYRIADAAGDEASETGYVDQEAVCHRSAGRVTCQYQRSHSRR